VKAKEGYEPDSDLRDTENVPLTWLEGETDALGFWRGNH
jgi:hypothetical protein